MTEAYCSTHPATMTTGIITTRFVAHDKSPTLPTDRISSAHALRQASGVFYLKFVAVRISSRNSYIIFHSTEDKQYISICTVSCKSSRRYSEPQLHFIHLRLACPIYNSAKHSPNKGTEHPQYLFTLYCLLIIYAYSVHWKSSDYSDFKVVYFSYLIMQQLMVVANISKRVLIVT